MYKRFTDDARQSMICANRHQQEYVGCLDIVIGVIESVPTVVKLLEHESIDVGEIRESAIGLLTAINSAGAKKAIEESISQASHFNSDEVNSLHILLGTLTAPDESVTLLFEKVGNGLIEVRVALIKHLSADNAT